jgi:type IV pilus assembly protein PilB
MTPRSDKTYADRLGETMVKRGLITADQLGQAKSRSTETGSPLNESMVEMGFVTDWELVAFVSHEAELPFVEIDPDLLQADVIKRLPINAAFKYGILPLGDRDGVVTVALANPLTVFSLDEIRDLLGGEVTPVLAKKEEISQLLKEAYGRASLLDEAISGVKDSSLNLPENELMSDVSLEALTAQPPIVKLVNDIILNAVNEGASDIHIEPRRAIVDLRTRVDGVLYKAVTLPRNMHMAVVSRIKIMANMDISERRAPQDGRIEVKMQGRLIDLRVSTFPTIYGEKVVLRILDKTASIIDLASLGFSKDDLEKVVKLVRRPYGMLLVVGPTGSGKSTTLYAALNSIVNTDINITTLEDPVEYEMSMVNQGQINLKAGLTFATGLRTLLRQDPDVIMIGEIRDLETAELSIRAALTGHMIFSTLHTMDAASATTRMADMGVEPFLLASALSGVIAQRLIRKICSKCRASYEPPPLLLKELGLTPKKGLVFYRGEGCAICHNTGYKGRTGIYEVLIMNETIKGLIMNRVSVDDIRKAAVAAGMKTLRDDGIAKALAGITTIDEVIRETAGDVI